MAEHDSKQSQSNENPSHQQAAAEQYASTAAATEAESVPGENVAAENVDPDAGAAELAELAAKLSEAEDRVLRAHAEAQNVRRRAEQEVDKARKFALEGFTRELLPVVDNLERALDTVDRENEALKNFIEGVELTRKSLLDAMSRFQIDVVDPLGQPFDSNVHEAISAVPKADAEPNSVIAVMQKGYTLNGRLVRPAMVVVAKAG